MVIAGIIKGLADEVGLLLGSQALSHGCPSRKTLAQGDRRLAADMPVSAIHEIKTDDAKLISHVVDH